MTVLELVYTYQVTFSPLNTLHSLILTELLATAGSEGIIYFIDFKTG
jgi:hypothetical protein